jgi:site-specific DNA recombinase
MKCSSEPVRAAIDARVSSDQQAEAGTIASQVEALEARLRRDGQPLEQELRFIDDGYGGTSLVRPALERLRDAAAEGAIDRVYVHSPDRLARSYAYQVLLVDELRRCGVELVFLNRPLGRSPEDDLLLQVQGVIAEYERAKIMERCRRGKLHAARRGSVSALAAAPYGYRYVTQREGRGTARYDVVPEQARVVQQVFSWVGQERCSIGAVCRRLLRLGVPSPGGKARWERKTVWAMLKNPAYQGTARLGKTRSGPYRRPLRPQRGRPEHPRRPCSVTRSEEPGVPIAVPAPVGEDLFAAVADQLEENRRRSRLTRRGARYLLQGLLVGEKCGYALYGKPISPAQSRGERRYTYYRCIGTDGDRLGGEKVCSNTQVRTDLLDEAVWQDVRALLREPERIAAEYRRRLEGDDRRGDVRGAEALQRLIGKVRRGIARLIDAYGEGLLEKEEFEPRIRAARERLARLQAEERERADAEARERELRLVIGRLGDFAERVGSGLQEADWVTRRAIVRALIGRVEVDGEAVRIVYRVGPYPFAEGPAGGLLQGCGGGVQSDLGVPIRLGDGLGRFAEVMEVTEWVGHTVERLLHRLADRVPAVGDHPDDRHRQRALHRADQLRQVVLGRGQQGSGAKDLAGEHIAEGPEHLVADVGLQPVDGQDHPARRGGHFPEPLGVRQRERPQLVIAIQQVANAPRADRHAAADQRGVDPRDAAMLGVAEGADQGDDVQAELVPGQRAAALLLGAQAGLVSGAVGVPTAADLQVQADQPLQGHDGPPRRGRGPEWTGAGGASPRVGRPIHGPIGPGASTPSRQGMTPRRDPRSRSNDFTALDQTDFAALAFLESNHA